MSANTLNTRFIACLCSVALFAVSAGAVALDTSAPRVAATVAELSQPATANGVTAAKQNDEAPDRGLAVF